MCGCEVLLVSNAPGKKQSCPEFCYHGNSFISFLCTGLHNHMFYHSTEAKMSNNHNQVSEGSRFHCCLQLATNTF